MLFPLLSFIHSFILSVFWEEVGISVELITGGGNYSLNAPTEVVKQIIINIEAGVEVEVTIAA